MRTATVTINHQARRLIRATEEELRSHLGPKGLSLDLLGEIYIRIQDVLARSGGAERTSAQDRARLVDELALSIYLVAAADEAGSAAAPKLLPNLRRALTEALKEAQAPATGGSPRLRKRRD